MTLAMGRFLMDSSPVIVDEKAGLPVFLTADGLGSRISNIYDAGRFFQSMKAFAMDENRPALFLSMFSIRISIPMP